MLCLETTGSLFRKLWSSGEGRVTVTGWAGLVRYHSLTLADHRLLQARVFWVPHRLAGEAHFVRLVSPRTLGSVNLMRY